MNNLLVAFITGLTTGGLSCLAVQGGLLASSLTSQIEKDFQDAGAKRNKNMVGIQPNRSKLAMPILAFLFTKLLAYTILGFLLGLVGQVFQLSPMARAFLQIAIGIFMLGNALRMFNVHPIFRFFVFEPPAFMRRFLRKTATGADGSSLITPAFLGFMTVLIPCGVTQAMMAVALGTGDPWLGAALMFAFTLGTSPVFFAVSYFATQIGAKMEKHFLRFVAVVVLVLAIVTINSGLALAGSPFTLSGLTDRVFPSLTRTVAEPANSSVAQASSQGTDDGVITITVENSGYYPNVLHAKAGIPITLTLVTDNVTSCSRAFVIPALGVEKILEQTGTATIQLPAQESGTQINYSCSMGMYSGIILFDL